MNNLVSAIAILILLTGLVPWWLIAIGLLLASRNTGGWWLMIFGFIVFLNTSIVMVMLGFFSIFIAYYVFSRLTKNLFFSKVELRNKLHV